MQNIKKRRNFVEKKEMDLLFGILMVMTIIMVLGTIIYDYFTKDE